MCNNFFIVFAACPNNHPYFVGNVSLANIYTFLQSYKTLGSCSYNYVCVFVCLHVRYTLLSSRLNDSIIHKFSRTSELRNPRETRVFVSRNFRNFEIISLPQDSMLFLTFSMNYVQL